MSYHLLFYQSSCKWVKSTMSTKSLKSYIETEMRLKTTNELVDIWVKNNRAEWTDEAFEVIQELLVERTGTIPIQNKPNYERVDMWSEDINNFFRSTNFLTAWLGISSFVVVLIGEFILELFFGKEVPDIYINILLIITLPLFITSGVIMIQRKEVARPGVASITGWAAVLEGVFIVCVSGICEIIAIIYLIRHL